MAGKTDFLNTFSEAGQKTNSAIQNTEVETTTGAPQIDEQTTEFVNTIIDKARLSAPQQQISSADYRNTSPLVNIGAGRLIPTYTQGSVEYPFALAEKMKQNRNAKELAVLEATQYTPPKVAALKDIAKNQNFQQGHYDWQQEQIKKYKAQAVAAGKPESYFAVFMNNDPAYLNKVREWNDVSSGFNTVYDAAEDVLVNGQNYSDATKAEVRDFYATVDLYNADNNMDHITKLKALKDRINKRSSVNKLAQDAVASLGTKTLESWKTINASDDYDVIEKAVREGKGYKIVQEGGKTYATVDMDAINQLADRYISQHGSFQSIPKDMLVEGIIAGLPFSDKKELKTPKKFNLKAKEQLARTRKGLDDQVTPTGGDETTITVPSGASTVELGVDAEGEKAWNKRKEIYQEVLDDDNATAEDKARAEQALSNFKSAVDTNEKGETVTKYWIEAPRKKEVKAKVYKPKKTTTIDVTGMTLTDANTGEKVTGKIGEYDVANVTVYDEKDGTTRQLTYLVTPAYLKDKDGEQTEIKNPDAGRSLFVELDESKEALKNKGFIPDIKNNQTATTENDLGSFEGEPVQQDDRGYFIIKNGVRKNLE